MKRISTQSAVGNGEIGLAQASLPPKKQNKNKIYHLYYFRRLTIELILFEKLWLSEQCYNKILKNEKK